MFKRICLFLLHKCWQFLALALILLAVLITVARYMMPSINDYRESIENLIAEKSGIQITIGQINGSWESLGPVLEINNISFTPLTGKHTNASTKQLQEEKSSIKSIKISISTFPSLFYRTLITDNLTISGLSLKIEQKLSGEFILADMTKATDDVTSIDPKFASTIQDWLQHQEELTLYNTALNITLRNDLQYPINLDEIHFKKGKGIYQLLGYSKLPGDNKIDFTLEVDGFLSDPATVGKLYIDTKKVNMAELPLNAIWNEAEISSGILEMKLWADWKNSQFESALISLNVDNFLMSLMGKPQTNLNKLSSYLVWQRQPDGWIFESQQTDIVSQNRIWPDASLSIRMRKDEQQKQYNVTASRLELGIWSDLFLATPNLDVDIRHQLLTMDPNGFLDDVRITGIIEKDTLSDIRINAHFSELTWQSWKKIPGVSKIAGQFEIHKDRGVLILDSRDSILDYPSLFRWPFTIKNINSKISWTLSDELISIELNHLNIDVTDAQLLADGLFDIHRDSDAVDMNLYAELSDGNVAKTKYFLPSGIMGDKLVNYLDQSIKSGSLQSAQISLRGPASHFPFANTEGVFAINAQVTNTQFVFTDGWPELNNISADLWFIENSMDIRVTEANSNGQKISKASAIIEDFSANPALLQVKSSSNGDAVDGMDYIYSSPLKSSIGKIFDIIPAKGPFDLDLDLLIPLSGEVNVRVDGLVHLKGNSILVKPIDMPITNINGDIRILDSLVDAKKLSAKLMEGKSLYSLKQKRDAKGLLLTTIQGKGEVSVAGVRSIFPDWIPKALEGKTAYNTLLLLPEAKTEAADAELLMDLTVDSDFAGMVSPFPAPFTKTAEQLERFHLNHQVLENNQQIFSVSLSELVNMKLYLPDQSAATGQIQFGGAKASISDKEGVELTGKFSHLDLQPWLEFLQKPDISMEKIDFSDYGHLYINNLLIEDLKYLVNFNQVLISANEQNNSLYFNLESEAISGKIQLPDTDLKLPINIDLSTLVIADQFPLLDKESDTEPASKAEQETNKESSAKPLPAIIMSCQKCTYNEHFIGSTNLTINPIIKGNEFMVQMKGAGILELDLLGDWKSNDSNNVVTTISGNLNSKKLGELLDIFNHKTGIHDTKLAAKGNLSWQGDPEQFNFETLKGDIAINAGKGNQEDISDKGARLFSILSVGSLARRLTLDFSDLFGAGFFYDGMKGNFTVTDGAFNTTNFMIDGTSADVEIKGVTDVTNNKIEKCILVTPKLSSSLPILAGWAIEPVTGLVVYLMSKIFQPALKVVTSILYKIEGPLNNPEVTEIAKSAGTAVVDITGDKEKMVITPDLDLPKFSCDGVFKH